MSNRLEICFAAALALSCSSPLTTAPGGRGGESGEPSGGAGAASQGGGTGPAAGSSGGTGGRGGEAGAPRGGAGGLGGSGSQPEGTGGQAVDAAAPETPAPSDAGIDGTQDSPDAPPAATNQGPVAAGTIAYSQDFENGQAGITLSPTNLPPSRAMIVDDPRGQRGKVMRLQWMVGDNFAIGRFRPRANLSNTGFYYGPNDKVSYAWGYMTESTYIGATLAQNITGGDPIWMIQGRDAGTMTMVPTGRTLPMRLEANKWYDFRVDVDYVPGTGATIDLYINGSKQFSYRGRLPVAPRAHWDGGIYLTGFGQTGVGNTTPRTVYISNLSVGKL